MRIPRRLALTLLATPALAQGAYPNRPVRMVVPFPAGAGTDLLARAYSQRLSDIWGQPVVVENRPGAGGTIGADAVAKATPDGYTLLMGNSSVLAIAPALYPGLPYDPLTAFDPIALGGANDCALVVRTAYPAQSIAEIVALAKARPGQLTWSSAGNGTSTHLAGELFRLMADIDILHVPYRGSPPALTDMLGGQVDMNMNTINAVLPAIRGNAARALATTGLTRDALLPDVPCFNELGYTGYESSGWLGFVAPAGTPPAVIARISEAMMRIGADPVFRERLNNAGMTPRSSTPEEFRAYLRSEVQRWGDVVRRSGAKLD